MSASKAPSSNFVSCLSLARAVVLLVATLACSATPAQTYYYSTPPMAGTQRSYHRLKALNSGFYAQVGEASTKNGAQVIQWDGADSMHGQWEIAWGFASYTGAPIRNRWSRQCLDVTSSTKGAPVVQNPCDGRSSQIWGLSNTGSGSVYIRHLNSGLDLNVEGAAIAIGARLILWPRQEGAANSMFLFESFSLVD
jgi:hypothetical protein